MSFNSLKFLIFLVVVLILYYIIPNKFRWILLLVASYYFYMSWNAALIVLILITTITSYLSGIFIERTDNKNKKIFWLVFALVVSLGILIFFKYINFILSSVIGFLNLFSLNLDSVFLDLILPVGISFYTFQTLSYVIDVYRGEYKAEKHFGYFALFVSFFPQLVAGPIERADNLIPQLKDNHIFNMDDFLAGFRIILVGFFRKCVIADVCGVYVNNVFNNIGDANTLSIFLAGLLFAVEIYNDFAGYSDIATGCARMMGIKLTKNFDRPFLSQSFNEMWSRWHITLNNWFRDYIYLPLNYRAMGKKHVKLRVYFNLLFVFIISGLWHGASWTYVLWGLFNGILMLIDQLTKKPIQNFYKKHNLNRNAKALVFLRRFLIILVMSFTGYFFRSNSIEQFFELMGRFFTSFGFSIEYFKSSFNSLGLNLTGFIQIALTIASMILIYNFGQFKKEEEDTILPNIKVKTFNVLQYSCYVYTFVIIALSWIMLIKTNDISSFAYFQF